MIQMPLLETRRLILRPFVPADAPALRKLVSDREIASTTLNIPHPYPAGAAEGFIAQTEEAVADGLACIYAVTRKPNGALVGCASLGGISTDHLRAELAYWVGRPYWGQGYATEAAGRMLRFGFEELELHKVWAAFMTRNPASGRVMEKIGMSREGIFRQHVRKWDRFEDLAFYGILRPEWEGRPV